MTSRSSPRKSPTKSTRNKKSDLDNNYQSQTSFTKGGAPVSDAQVEIDHLKTTIIALNEKVEVTSIT